MHRIPSIDRIRELKEEIAALVKLNAIGCGSFRFKVKAQSFTEIDGARRIHAGRIGGISTLQRDNW